jgi:hypothetical protein
LAPVRSLTADETKKGGDEEFVETVSGSGEKRKW